MKSPGKVISIITPSFNQGEFIAETIESVISQEGNFHLDYIIIDANSTDHSLEIIRKYETLLQTGTWQINCLSVTYRWSSELDAGQSDGVNKGFSVAVGSILGWLNSDDVYYPGTLQQIAKLDWSKIDFCYGGGMWIDRSGADLGRYPTFSPNRYSLYLHCTLCQPAVFFNSNSYASLGGVSLQYNLVMDYEYWLRAVFSGMKFLRIKSLLAKSRMYHDNKSLSSPIIAGREKCALLTLYYSSRSLNSLLLYYWRFIVDSNTRKMNNAMLAKLRAEY